MSEESIQPSVQFQDELDLLDKEIESVDKLYNMVLKEIKDAREGGEDARNARLARHVQNPNTFIYNMFANANSIKSNKISLIAHRVQIKKVMEELRLKNRNSEEEGGKVKMVLAELVKQISDKKAQDVIDGNEDNEIEVDNEEALEEEARKAYQASMDENPKIDIKEDDDESENDDRDLIDESKLAISTDGKLYMLNDNDEIDSELELDEREFYIERNKKGKVTYAKTISTNKEIQIIEVEDE